MTGHYELKSSHCMSLYLTTSRNGCEFSVIPFYKTSILQQHETNAVNKDRNKEVEKDE